MACVPSLLLVAFCHRSVFLIECVQGPVIHRCSYPDLSLGVFAYTRFQGVRLGCFEISRIPAVIVFFLGLFCLSWVPPFSLPKFPLSLFSPPPMKQLRIGEKALLWPFNGLVSRYGATPTQVPEVRYQ